MDQRSKIAILGFGVEGRAVLDYLIEHGYSQVTVCDKNVDLKAELPDGVSAHLGQEVYLKGLNEFDVLFRSPGIPYLLPEIQSAKELGVEVTSGTKFFMEQCPCPVIGVTGTKGKGTTSSLIYEMLKASGRRADIEVFLGGNIGRSPIEFLDQLKPDSLVVLELSSFQLQDLKKSPKYAVLLNTTSDHLDYHVDVGEYMRAKENLLAHQNANSVAVLNRDYEYEKQYRPLIKGALREVSVKHKVDDGACVYGGEIFWMDYGDAEKICSVSEVELVGSHNLENILPAVVIAKELKVHTDQIAEVIRTFKNLPYRLQIVRELNGVRYFNDSYSTTPETSMAAVDSFDEDTVLIAGGSDKGADYMEWALKILSKPSLKTVILIGENADKMERTLMEAEEQLGEALGSPTKILRRMNMEDAVVAAYAELPGPGVVVMSPAAASFGLYKNYKERGNDFVAQVRKLK